jgi:transposase
MTKNTDEFKYQVVQEYLDGAMGYVALGKKYNLDDEMIRRWVGLYRAHGTEGLKKKFTHYSAEFKLSVLTHIWDNALSYSQAAAHFNIRNPGILTHWVRLYREGGLDALQPRRKGRPRSMSNPIAKPSEDQEQTPLSQEALLKELNHLRLENAYLKKLQALVQAKQKLAQERKRK